MADCPRLAGCPFFNDKFEKMPSMAEMLKTFYCRNDFKNCARFRVAEKLGKERVPADMYPPDKAAADRLLAETA